MHIDIWLDFSCPFCYIGKKRFEDALKKLKKDSHVTISYKSYLLQPYITAEETQSSAEVLANHKDISVEEATNIQNRLAQMAFEDGIKMNFEDLIPTTTLFAHKILKEIHGQDQQTLFINAIYQSHFELGENIGSLEVLIKYGLLAGLTKERIIECYHSVAHNDAIQEDIIEAEKIGVKGVPFFVANHKYGLPGAQPTYVFLEMLEDLYYEERPKNHSKTEYCVGDNCNRK